VEDLVRRLGVPLEICLTSNAQTGAVDRIEDHPLPDYLRKNIVVTLNTDDPGVSGMKLSTDYEKAVKLFKFTLDDLLKITLNGVNCAFLPDSEKIVLAERIRQGFEEAALWLQEQKQPQI
jgi:adenosine deaminase